MADLWFRPVDAEAHDLPGHDGVLVCIDRDGNRAFLDMPNLAGAAFIAAALSNELKDRRHA